MHRTSPGRAAYMGGTSTSTSEYAHSFVGSVERLRLFARPGPGSLGGSRGGAGREVETAGALRAP